MSAQPTYTNHRVTRSTMPVQRMSPETKPNFTAVTGTIAFGVTGVLAVLNMAAGNYLIAWILAAGFVALTLSVWATGKANRRIKSEQAKFRQALVDAEFAKRDRFLAEQAEKVAR
jgi:ABC-type transport system involved in cytochrome bd biosynthesis fused ATPase/permease subunit